jgi:magnesium-dependent phosphatase 1
MKEIFSSWTHKTEHFQKIQRKTGIPYKSMLFFDDEDRNIDPVITYSHCAHLILAISKI